MLASTLFVFGCGEEVAPPASRTISLYDDVTVHFTPEDPELYDSPFASARDNGRIMATYREMPENIGPAKITAVLRVHPIRKDIRNVIDRWDRAGHVSLIKPGMAPIEILKFMTAYGGDIDHEVDVTHLAPLLTGHCEFELFIDTWVTPAWTVDVELVITPRAQANAPAWVEGLWFPEGGLTAEVPSVTTTVSVPDHTRRTSLYVMMSGHCTDGRDADEFVTKDNVVLVDGVEVVRWRPWRDDCGEFRAVNPYCARWADGSWSSDYSRSNWCPGDVVEPEVFELELAPGEHEITYLVEDIRPEDDSGKGYWRLSGSLAGWR